MLDPTHLRSLIAVCDAGGIAAAARRLGRPPSAIATHLERLSAQVGRPLVRRAGRVVEVTPDGALLVAEGRGPLMDLDRLHACFRGTTQTPIIRLGLPEVSRSGEIIAAVGRFQCEAGVQVDISAAPSEVLRTMADDRRIDVAVALSHGTDPDADGPPLWVDRLAWVRAADTAHDPAVLRIVDHREGCPYHDTIVSALRRAGLSWTTSFVATGHAGLIDAVRAGLGVSVLDADFATRLGLVPCADDRLPPLRPTPFVACQPRATAMGRSLVRALRAALGDPE